MLFIAKSGQNWRTNPNFFNDNNVRFKKEQQKYLFFAYISFLPILEFCNFRDFFHHFWLHKKYSINKLSIWVFSLFFRFFKTGMWTIFRNFLPCFKKHNLKFGKFVKTSGKLAKLWKMRQIHENSKSSLKIKHWKIRKIHPNRENLESGLQNRGNDSKFQSTIRIVKLCSAGLLQFDDFSVLFFCRTKPPHFHKFYFQFGFHVLIL